MAKTLACGVTTLPGRTRPAMSATTYGKKYEGVIRSSVVIDGMGKVAAVFDKIQPKQQSAKALKALKAVRELL